MLFRNTRIHEKFREAFFSFPASRSLFFAMSIQEGKGHGAPAGQDFLFSLRSVKPAGSGAGEISRLRLFAAGRPSGLSQGGSGHYTQRRKSHEKTAS
jgi:hypothetical protein